MTALAVRYLGGFSELWRQIAAAGQLQFWLLAAGFIWVIGDIFQQYAVKYIGVSRGIPLSNSNQLWGLVWGAVAFREFRGWGHSAVAAALYGSTLMALGLAAISFSTANKAEHGKWREAADREQRRYGIDAQFVSSAMEGRPLPTASARRWWDGLLVLAATAIFVWRASVSSLPSITLNWQAVFGLIGLGLALLLAATISLWKLTRFN